MREYLSLSTAIIYCQQTQLQVKKNNYFKNAAESRNSLFISVLSYLSTDASNLCSATRIQIDNQRIQIWGCLMGIIPVLKYNGTIINIIGYFVIVLH